MKETYVKIETAQLLKEKGFDLDTDKVYERSLMACRYEDYPMPTQQMACRWLAEEKHIFIGKSFAKNKETLNLEFHSPVFNMDTGELITTIGAFCPEDAVEAALQYCLTKLIEQ